MSSLNMCAVSRNSFRLHLFGKLSSCVCGVRNLHPAIPRLPVPSVFKRPEKSAKVIIDSATIQHLERISLVDFANVRGIERLEEAIELAEVIKSVDTTGIEPMYSILEDESLYIRDDVAEPPNCRKELMGIASETEEEYFVAPQGNIPLSSSKSYDRDSR